MNVYAAMTLWEVIRPLIPYNAEVNEAMENIIQRVDIDTMSRALALMMGVEVSELPEVTTSEMLVNFTKGIQENKIIELNQFLEDVGYGK